jgi:hypothetical protein
MKSRIVELGRQLGLTTEQINSIMDDTLQDIEPVSLSLGPPHYPGAHYGTVSIIDFNYERKMKKRNITELGKQLGLSTEQIHSVMDNGPHSTESISLSLGPPHYSGSFYGTVSINDFKF